MTRIAALPSRQGLMSPIPRPQLAENLSRTYEALWRAAIATHNAHVYTTWAQLAAMCGYEHAARSSIANWLDLLVEAGLIEYGGDKDQTGRWLRLRITLLAPAGLLSGTAPVAQLDGATLTCEARRRRETRSQRRSRRVKPWCRQGGQGTPGVSPRWDFFWPETWQSVVLGRPSGTTSPRGGQAEVKTDAATGANRAGNGLSDAIEAGAQRAGTAAPRRSAGVANGGHRDRGDRSGSRSEASLATRQRDEFFADWDRWAATVGPRLRELSRLRNPVYADMAEAFELAQSRSPWGDVWAEGRHARLKTRQGLEREAARYDRYAGRLAAEGVELRHRTSMGLLIEAYAGGGCVSPGAPLAALGKTARSLRRRWHERHPDVKLRRRRERIIRQTLERTLPPSLRAGRIARVEPRRPFEGDPPEQWRRWSEWQQGEEWLRQLLERPEADGC
jgi:hypothetical protein